MMKWDEYEHTIQSDDQQILCAVANRIQHFEQEGNESKDAVKKYIKRCLTNSEQITGGAKENFFLNNKLKFYTINK